MFAPQLQHQNISNESTYDSSSICHNENVLWLVQDEALRQKSNASTRYKSPYAAKVRWEHWVEKKGCCKTIGPPPNVCGQCPEDFLRKHSRQVPVFFTADELRVTADINERLKQYQYEEPPPVRNRLPPLDTGRKNVYRQDHDEHGCPCPFQRPPSRLGLFRSSYEPSYEERYKINKPIVPPCSTESWENILRQASEKARVLTTQMETQQRHKANDSKPTKDFIRSNAVHAIRMPARRLRRCYVDECGVHVVDMSDSPYVLRPGFGKIPAYLYRRKWELYEKDLAAKRFLCLNEFPEGDGLQRVVEEEKEMVIHGLKEHWSYLLTQYNSLPLNVTGNERLRETKHGLEERMKEVENDLKLLTSSGELFVGDVKQSRYL